MFTSRLLSLALVVVLFVPARSAGQALPNIALAQVRYSSMKASVRPQGDLAREIAAVDAALADATRAGRTGEVRRLLAKGLSLLSGQAWTDILDFSNSLVLRADRVFVDSSTPYTVRIEQIYAPSLRLSSSLVAQFRVREAVPTLLPGSARAGNVEKAFPPFAGVARDLRESPFLADLDLTGIADGRHLLEAELLDGTRSLGTCALAIDVRKGFDARLEKLGQAAKALPARAADVQADVLYPIDYVRRANRGRIELGTFDSGIELASAEATLAAAKAGKDPFARRTGDFERHYLLREAGEIMPYHVFVPRAYDGSRPFPLVVALHGLGVDENSFFTAYGKRLPALAEERGYLVVAPLGYRVDGAYGYSLGVSVQDAAQTRKRELSEADVLAVLELARKQYKVDERRIYLLGHSMGAIGGWYLGAKYPDRWAAIAAFSGFGVPATVAKMKDIAQFVVHGDADGTVPVIGSRAMVAEMKRLGVEHRYVEVPGGTHLDVVEPNLAAAFDFFDTHKRAGS